MAFLDVSATLFSNIEPESPVPQKEVKHFHEGIWVGVHDRKVRRLLLKNRRFYIAQHRFAIGHRLEGSHSVVSDDELIQENIGFSNYLQGLFTGYSLNQDKFK